MDSAEALTGWGLAVAIRLTFRVVVLGLMARDRAGVCCSRAEVTAVVVVGCELDTALLRELVTVGL